MRSHWKFCFLFFLLAVVSHCQMDGTNSTSGGGSNSSLQQVPLDLSQVQADMARNGVGNYLMFTLAVLYFVILIAGICCLSFGKTRKCGLVVLTALAITYNVHYILHTSSALKYTVSLGDVLVNLPESLGITSVDSWDEVPAGMVTCEDCSFLDYKYHMLFIMEYYDSVTNSGFERFRLLCHIFFNTVALGVILIQFLNYSSSPRTHKRIGYVVIICTSIGTSCALWIGTGHSRKAYGYHGEPCGWLLMGGSLLASMYCALYYARKGDYIAHGRWMVRFYGGLWASYFLWRILAFAAALFLRSYETAPAWIMYFSTPLGIWLADLLDKKLNYRSAREAGMQGKSAAEHKGGRRVWPVEQEDGPVNEPTLTISNVEESDITDVIHSPPSPEASDGGACYSMEVVAKHATKDDCWIVVNGQVLNVTNFLSQHPGGEKAIFNFAGKDATMTFNKVHSPDMIGKRVPDAVIGTLSQ